MMLTPAQYKALKAWPDDRRKTGCVSIIYSLINSGLLRSETSNYISKNSSACDDAIREYEAAQNLSNQANLSDALQRYKSEKEALK